MLKTMRVVEDDDTMCDLAKLHLSTAGYAVRTARDPAAESHEAPAA